MALRLNEWLGRTLAHCLKVVALWIDDEGREVVWTIVLPQPGFPIVSCSSRHCRGVEADDGVVGLRGKGNVEAMHRAGDGTGKLLEGQLVPSACYAVADGLVLFSWPQIAPDAHVAEWAERCVIEAGCSLNVGDAQRNVVKHVHWVFAEVASPPAVVLGRPNVRAEAGPTAKRQARAVENAPADCAGLAF